MYKYLAAPALLLALNQFAYIVAKTTEITIGDTQSIFEHGNRAFYEHDFERALHHFEYLLTYAPYSNALYYNIGKTLVELTEYEKAIQAFKKAHEYKPTCIETQCALATALLALGDYEQGWKYYEARWLRPERSSLPFQFPGWDGKKSLDNKTILLLNEGALGDCFQFIRYAHALKKLYHCTVHVHVPRLLHSVLSRCSYIDGFIDNPFQQYRANYYTSLMSLPALLHTTLETVPCDIPYISPCPKQLEQWQNKVDPSLFNIGVCWYADRENDANRPPLAQRSFAPEFFAPLVQLPKIRLYSLHTTSSGTPFIHTFESLDAHHGNFMDTAALMHHMDLVICVDTSIAHLAGAMGIKTWLILPFKSDWRWLKNGTQTPWYPTMTLYRAAKNESFASVVQRIKKDLEIFINGKST